MTYTRTGFTAGSLSWQKVRQTKVARYNLYMSFNQSFPTELVDLVANNTLSLSTFGDGFFSISDYSNYSIVSNEIVCGNWCLANATCVQAVYFFENFVDSNGAIWAPKGSCYLNNDIDMTKAIRKQTHVKIMSVTSKIQIKFI